MKLRYLIVIFFALTIAVYFALYSRGGVSYYVSPLGDDSNSGISPDAALKTIQEAINLAQPGDTINLADGTYSQDIITKRDGTKNRPITIKGSADAILKGEMKARIFEVNHSYIYVEGFTIDGLREPDEASSYRKKHKLLFIHGKKPKRGPKGIKVTNMTFRNAGGECLRLRYFVEETEIAYNTFSNCGIYDFKFNGGGKNGEAIYIGTSSKQWDDGKNPTDDPDQSSNNWIHDNTMDTQGNECVDIKEGATDNIIEYNKCTGQKDPNSGGFSSRGDSNIFRYNEIYDNIGTGFWLGERKVNGVQYGMNNDVYENNIRDNTRGGIGFQVMPQGQVCGNTIVNDDEKGSIGKYGSELDPTQPCNPS
ncbi:right-handed parallel beta-helix repeat-containing protein [Patescibacteria group bacterium]|nr:right-handed parallel beta-helix repeat-containing protein [Patescibacteria group bacterium]